MAFFLEAKTPDDLKTYTFTPELPAGDKVASYVLTPSGVTLDLTEELEGVIVFALAGGTAGATATIAVEVMTGGGDVLNYTLYVPIIASAAQIAQTAREYANFALRRIVGVGEVATAAELEDALERLNALIGEMRGIGADIGAAFPLRAETVIYCPDYAVGALRANLLLDCLPAYGEQPTALDVMNARRGMALVRNMNLPEDRAGEYY